MKSQMLGTLALVALANVAASGAALAKEEAKKAKGEAGWCKANSCKDSVAGGKNECGGQEAKGVKDKAACEKDGKGTWTAEAKPK
jgi:hypothetical protein